MGVTRFPARASGTAERVAGFIAHLRANGLPAGPRETADSIAALAAIDAGDREAARLALRALLTGDAERWQRFDALFDAYWLNAGRTRDRAAATRGARPSHPLPAIWQSGGEAENESGSTRTPGAGSDEAEDGEGRLVATPTDSLARRDLRELAAPEDQAEAARVAERLARALRDRRSRRRRAARRGRALDLRRVLRASLARGGEPIDLPRRRRPDRPMHIVALCDVSGSMEAYARVFLAFLKGLIDTETTADAYLFHTRLMRITPALRDRDTLRAADRLSLMAEGFGGGTDIGASLRAFNDHHATRAVGARCLVLILSDGYCTAPPERLGAELGRLRRRAGRIVWLNPLKSWRDHAPVAAGIAAALPHLDAHLSANTLEALAGLEAEFARL
jgi:uncharacterized protein with von Willebrand factor type A (vWA) domain